VLNIKIIFLFFGACLVLTGIVMAFKSRRCEQSEKINAAMQMFTAVFITKTYLLFLCAYNSFMDPAVDLSTRVLSPVYAPAIILVICVTYKLSRLGTRVPLLAGVFSFSHFALIVIKAKHCRRFCGGADTMMEVVCQSGLGRFTKYRVPIETRHRLEHSTPMVSMRFIF
jgi:hypothetical protein